MALGNDNGDFFHTLNLRQLPVAINPQECRIYTPPDPIKVYRFVIMITDTIYSPKNLAGALSEVFAAIGTTVSAVPAENVNVQPATGGWSVAQVMDHLTKSNRSIVKALKLHGTQINREPTERVQELKDIFLDYSKKFDAPSFIIPSNQPLDKTEITSGFTQSGEDIIQAAEHTNTSEMIDHPAFGDITKLEILHFVLYHSIRHKRQIDNIIKSIQ